MIVTLTTDFGLRDGYVAALKGAILQAAPGACLVDVSHEIAPQDVMEAAFVLAQAAPHFPPGTVHLAVVDPGVGTERRAVAAALADGTRFVGPDNGLLALLAGPEGPAEAVQLDRPGAWREPEPSRTFHGRDVFGPVAGKLAAGAALADVGSPAHDLTPLLWPLPIVDAQGITGMVLHVDRYGNALTNITRDVVAGADVGRQARVILRSAILRGLAPTYGAVAPGEPLALFGSDGRLEVAVRDGNAARLLSITRGDSVTLLFEPSGRHAERVSGRAGRPVAA